jgi:hypothetical protein
MSKSGEWREARSPGAQLVYLAVPNIIRSVLKGVFTRLYFTEKVGFKDEPL